MLLPDVNVLVHAHRRDAPDRGFARFPGLRWRHPLAPVARSSVGS